MSEIGDKLKGFDFGPIPEGVAWEGVSTEAARIQRESKAVAENTAAAAKKMMSANRLKLIRGKLADLALLVLESDARSIQYEDPEKIDRFVTPPLDHPSRKAVATALGVRVEDVQELVDTVNETEGEGTWDLLVIESRTRLALGSSTVRGANWNKVESIALQKLAQMLDEGRVTTASDLLAIANVANRANRNTTIPGVPATGDGASTGVNISIFGGADMSAKLPAGNLGTINLTLSTRMKEQLQTQTDGRRRRILEESKMLTVEELREIASPSIESEPEE